MSDISKRMCSCDNNKGTTGACAAVRSRNQFLSCAACHSKVYCNVKCQRRDWKMGHDKECAALAVKYQRRQNKLKRRDVRLKRARKQAEAKGETFNEAMAALFMDSDSDDDDEDEDEKNDVDNDKSDSCSKGTSEDELSRTDNSSRTSDEQKEKLAAAASADDEAEALRLQEEAKRLAGEVQKSHKIERKSRGKKTSTRSSSPRRQRSSPQEHHTKKRITCI